MRRPTCARSDQRRAPVDLQGLADEQSEALAQVAKALAKQTPAGARL